MMNWGDVLVLAVLGLIIGAVIGKMYRDKKAGKHCSCGSCQGCSMGCSCASQNPEPTCSCSCGGTKE